MGTLLASGAVQRADILKIAHHGAANGGTEIIDVVRPAVALISVEKENTYGHPSPDIIGALRDRGVPALRTDEHETLVLGWKDGGLSVSALESLRPAHISCRHPFRKPLMRALRIVFMGFSIHYVRVRSWLRHEAHLRAPGFPAGRLPGGDHPAAGTRGAACIPGL